MSRDLFDWQAEDQQLLPAQRPENRRTPDRRWLLLLLLLLPAAFFAYREWRIRLDAGIVQEVADNHLRLREALLLGDEARFLAGVSAAEAEWAAAQQALFVQRAWLERDILGLRWQRALSPPITSTLPAGAPAAEVVTSETYTRTNTAGTVETLRLQQTAHYRWEEDGWQLAPPDAAYWGEEQVTGRPHLQLTYPARDSELAERLAGDLDDFVARTCTELADMACPAGYRLQVRFSGDPESLLLPAGDEGATDSLTLPTPTLAGRPGDEPAYAALRDGYARHVVRAVVADTVGWQCCRGQIFFDALLDYQLRELGLPAGQAVRADYARVIREKLSPGDLYGLWGLAPERFRPVTVARVRVVVGFLLQREPAVSLVEWQQRLAQANSYREWAGELAAQQLTPKTRAAWMGYLYSNAGVADNETASPPQKDILLLCLDPADTDGRPPDEQLLLRYDAERGELRPELPGLLTGSSWLFSTADNTALLVQGLSSSRLKLSLVGSGNEQVIFEESFSGSRTWVTGSPHGNFLVVGLYDPAVGINALHLLDVAACRGRGCPLQPLLSGRFGQTVWSTDERHFLIYQEDGLYLGATAAGSAERIIAAPDSGYYEPFWLDEETYGYFHFQFSSEGDWPLSWLQPLAATISESQPELLYRLDDLLALLPDVAPTYVRILPNPADSQRPYVILDDRITQTSHVLLLNRRTGEAQVLLEAPGAEAASFTLSPDGRWLTYSGEGQLFLYDVDRQLTLEQEAILGAHFLRWTADSKWLLALGENTLTLVSPATGDSHVQIDPQLNCLEAVWVADGS